MFEDGNSPGEKQAFVWHDYRKWRTRILRELRDVITEDVFECFREAQPENFSADGCEVINSAIKAASGQSVDIKSVLAAQFRTLFPAVRAFHGCRGESSASYLERGILRGNAERSKATARAIFDRPERMDAIFTELQSYLIHNSGKVFFLLTPEQFVRNGTDHYLRFGSELLVAVANRLGQERTLASKGRGMVIECDVATRDISSDTVHSLSGLALAEIFRRCAKGDAFYSGDFGFWIECDLHRDRVVKIHYPLN